MKLDVSVKNLGQIKEATFNIRPMTVITGPNGTGKSFFTKSLYSILSVINKNVFHEELSKTILDIHLQLDTIIGIREKEGQDVQIIKDSKDKFEKFEREFNRAKRWKIHDYFALMSYKISDVQAISNDFENYFKKVDTSTFNLKVLFEECIQNFKRIESHIELPNYYYSQFLIGHLENGIKDNFQISSIKELISFEEEISEIKVDGLLSVEFRSKKNESNLADFLGIIPKTHLLQLTAGFIDYVSSLSSVVFFESPAYWKVREALKFAKNNQSRLPIVGRQSDDVLTGVPQYFYELDDALSIKTKTEGKFKSATDLLETAIGGEFTFKGDNLSFKDKTGREISKNLISFGMTNLGMIQALLKHNVITEGSFIFIDEPETNLHPDWQVKLAEVLLVLAQGGVNIVIITHSSDFVKALEVKIKKLHIEVMEDFLSVHFVDVYGKLLEFESTDKIQQLIEARELLSLAYQELYLSDL